MAGPQGQVLVNAAAEAIQGQREVAGSSLWVDARRTLRRNRAAMVSAVVIGVMAVAVLVGPLFTQCYDCPNYGNANQPPSWRHSCGTDELGRDLLARILHGGRISLTVGLAATLVSLLIGISYGAIAGYFGGRLDNLMMRVVDILYAIPFIFVVILLMMLFGRHIVLLFVALGSIIWLDMARIVRGQTLSLKHREFVEAARAQGVGTFAVIRRHIVPNLLGVVAVYVTLTIPQVILMESFLSFLGLGVQPPMPSWGALVKDGLGAIESAPWLLFFPALSLATTLFCFNFLGDGMRDALDPKDR